MREGSKRQDRPSVLQEHSPMYSTREQGFVSHIYFFMLAKGLKINTILWSGKLFLCIEMNLKDNVLSTNVLNSCFCKWPESRNNMKVCQHVNTCIDCGIFIWWNNHYSVMKWNELLICTDMECFLKHAVWRKPEKEVYICTISMCLQFDILSVRLQNIQVNVCWQKAG